MFSRATESSGFTRPPSTTGRRPTASKSTTCLGGVMRANAPTRYSATIASATSGTNRAGPVRAGTGSSSGARAAGLVRVRERNCTRKMPKCNTRPTLTSAHEAYGSSQPGFFTTCSTVVASVFSSKLLW
jgi:hypothetical protein